MAGRAGADEPAGRCVAARAKGRMIVRIQGGCAGLARDPAAARACLVFVVLCTRTRPLASGIADRRGAARREAMLS